jgi:colanic acid biosynthesis glycosyl transferase WcaI
MRILIYGLNFAPEQIGIGKYSGDMAAWLAEQGHEVRVVAAPPYYPNWKVDPAYRKASFRKERWRGVQIFRAPVWVPSKPSGLKRILHLMSFAVASFPVMMRQSFWGPDLTIVIAPALMCAPAALLISWLCRSENWLHIQDFEVDCAFELGLLKGKVLRWVLSALERAILRGFDHVSTISQQMLARLGEKGVQANRLCFFPNWVDMSHVHPTANSSGFRSELGIPAGAVVVLFSGCLGGKQGLMIIPETAKLMADRSDIVFVVCGDGVLKPALTRAAGELANVRFIPLQPYERLGDLLGMADIHLLPQSPNAADLVLPSKLSGMLASGRPIVATCNYGTELQRIVSGCGAVVPPEDGQALSTVIAQLATNAELRNDLGRKARIYAETHFERDAVLRRVFGLLRRDEEVVAAEVPHLPEDPPLDAGSTR